MKVIIPEDRLERMVFKYLDTKFEGLEQTKGKYFDIVFRYPGEEYGTLGWEKSGKLWIYYGLIDDISSFFPIEKSEIQKIIGRYVENRYNLKVKNTFPIENIQDYMLKIDTI